MNRGSHITYGVCMAALVAFETKGYVSLGAVRAMSVAAAPFAIVGAFLPDIDVKRANIRKTWKSLSVLIMTIMTIPLIITTLSLFSILPLMLPNALQPMILMLAGAALFNLIAAYQLKHRTWTHSMDVAILFYALMYFTEVRVPSLAVQLNSVLFGIFVGFSSHLIFDGMTDKGVWLSYLLKIKIHLLPKPFRITTGGKSEQIFTIFVVIITILYLILKAGGF